MNGSKSIEIVGKDFVIDGVRTQIRSGAMHYFRIHPAYWRDRLLKLKQCGLNTVETYMAWNMHEATEGCYDFSGWADVAAFVREAQSLGLMVMVRPGPYICSEWEFGGIPAWLLGKPGLRIRCMNPVWLEAVDRYLERMCEELRGLQWTAGGPIIMMQVENEYGSVGDDVNYIRHVYEELRRHGMDIPLFISDSPGAATFACGAIPETLLTANGRNHPGQLLDAVQRIRPGAPEMVMELWSGVSHKWGQRGWLTHDATEVGKDVEELMTRGASFNFYMFHGGTSFGFHGGSVAERNGNYLPYVNSYDCDAPLDEAGNPTEKYRLIQSIIKKHCPEAWTEEPQVRPARSYGRIELTESALLLDQLEALSTAVESVTPEPMEHYGQSLGFILYSKDLRTVSQSRWSRLTLENLADRAQIFVDGIYQGTIYRADREQSITVPTGKVDILVESMGHTNAGMGVQSRFEKGVTGVIHDGGRRLYNWTVRCLPLEDLSAITYGPLVANGNAPAFHRGCLTVDRAEDTWLRVTAGWKGVVWVNGFNLGRYWQLGPMYSLYLPAPLLHEGKNDIVVLELHGLRNQAFVDSLAQVDRAPSVPLLL